MVVPKATYKINAHNQLSLGAALSCYLGHGVGSVVDGGRAVRRGRAWWGSTVAMAIGSAWRRASLRGVSWGPSLGRVGRLLGRVARRAGVDGGQRTGRAAVC